MGDRKAKFKVMIELADDSKLAKGKINGKPFISTLGMHYNTPKWSHVINGNPATRTEAGTLSGYIKKLEREQMLERLSKC